jgi:hypothetical protein
MNRQHEEDEVMSAKTLPQESQTEASQHRNYRARQVGRKIIGPEWEQYYSDQPDAENLLPSAIEGRIGYHERVILAMQRNIQNYLYYIPRIVDH